MRLRDVKAGAERQLGRFKQASLVAVALTGFLLLLAGGDEAGAATQQPSPLDTAAAVGDTLSEADTVAAEIDRPVRADSLAREATAEAADTFSELWEGFVTLLPKLLVSVLVLLLAWGLTRLLRPILRRALGRWERGNAAAALIGVALWLLALGVAVSVLAGDIRALVGSLGLVGLALSWALQTPIESFTGWLLNSFQGYYLVGDRIAVGDVFGDVVRIDFLTTTVWEIGGPDHPPSVIQAEQPTGRLITFPNSEVLTGSIVNYTRDFDYVWDELAVSVAAESDIRYAAQIAERVASELLEGPMEEPARRYRAILEEAGLNADVPARPTVYYTLTQSGVDLTVRYLTGARERRKWKSELGAVLIEAFNQPEHGEKVFPVYPRHQIQLVGAAGRPQTWPPSTSERHPR